MPIKKNEEYGFTVALGLEDEVVTLDPITIQELYFIEDIFSFCMTGKIIFQDPFGMTEFGPLTGNERLLIAYGTTTERRLVFDIIKMDKITMASPTKPIDGIQICLYFVDVTFNRFTKNRYSKSWKNAKITDILENVLFKMVEDEGPAEKILLNEGGRYDKTDQRIDLTTPYWTPMTIVQYLNKKARPKDMLTDGKLLGGYLYYNNTRWPGNTSKNVDNNFTSAWTSINNLFSYPANSDNEVWMDQNDFVFSNAPSPTSQDTANSEGDMLNVDGPTYVNKILDWTYGGIDYINTRKLQGAHVLGYNFDGKQLIDKTFKYSKKNDTNNTDYGLADDATILGRRTLFTDISEFNSEIILTSLTSDDAIKDKYFYEWLRRYSKQQVLSVIVRGWEERFAGRMVNIIWPSTDKKDYNGNKNWIGVYVTKSVTHTWGIKNGYKQRLVLLKNGYYDSNKDSLIPSLHRNMNSLKPIGS